MASNSLFSEEGPDGAGGAAAGLGLAEVAGRTGVDDAVVAGFRGFAVGFARAWGNFDLRNFEVA